MSVRAVRRAVLALSAAGIVAMIVASIADNTGAAITFGLVTAVAVVGLILVTAVTAGAEGGSGTIGATDEIAHSVEMQVGALVDDGADEGRVRALVAEAVRLGRRLPRG